MDRIGFGKKNSNPYPLKLDKDTDSIGEKDKENVNMNAKGIWEKTNTNVLINISSSLINNKIHLFLCFYFEKYNRLNYYFFTNK